MDLCYLLYFLRQNQLSTVVNSNESCEIHKQAVNSTRDCHIRVVELGIVNTVMILLNAVRMTESATSPFTRYVIKFDDGPPGHNASIINPTAIDHLSCTSP